MTPNLLHGDDVLVAPLDPAGLCRGDVVLAENADGLTLHRVGSLDPASGVVTLRSDTGFDVDLPATRIFGKVRSRRQGAQEQPLTPFQTLCVHPIRVLARRACAAAKLRFGRLALLLFGLLTLFLLCSTWLVPAAQAQSADLSLTQTASVTTIPVGTNYSYSEVVKNVNSIATVASGAIIVYLQTPPNTTYRSSAGTNWNCGTNPGSGGTGPIVCTYNATLASGATASTLTLTFRVNAGVAAGTTILSSATVTTNGNNFVTDTNPSNNTSITSIYVEPAASADVALSMSVSPTPVFVSSALTYAITVQNLGPASATGVTVADTLPSSLTFGSATPSQGTCSGGLNLSCPLGTIAANASATVVVALTTPPSATTLTNTATVSTTSTDNNQANNSATAYTVVQPLACATPGRDGAGGTLSGVVNAYYPPAATGVLASGSTSVTLGAAAGSPAAQTPISAGDLLLVIQMQGAAINNANSSSYGHGVPGDPGAGSIAIGSSGLFEFVTATNSTPVPVTGGTVQFTGTGPTGGLLNSYTYALASAAAALNTATAASWANNIASFTFPTPLPASIVPDSVLTTTGFAPAGYNVTQAAILSVNSATGVITVSLTTNPGTETGLGTGSVSTQGQQTYQVIRVPQYTSATLGSGLVPLAWNGSLGGVLAIDVSSQLALGGSTVALDALGFRGGGGITLSGTTNTVSDTDYVTSSPANLPNLSGGGDAPANSGTDASKGEGIAGTPHWVAPRLSTVLPATTAISTGQSVVEGLIGGSFARGAPGNAGGGGTDGDPSNNDDNSGGGAGGNGGGGGQGGYGWNSIATTNTTDGGFGGVPFPASTSALVMGGGGGAGSVNNGTYYIPGGASGADCGTSCTGIFSSGGHGGGIAIIHAGSVAGTGTITSNGESTLSTLNDSTGGAGAGGSILIFTNSGNLSGLAVSAVGGSAGNAWPTEGPDQNTTGFPGQRHGPGGGGGGGVIFLSSAPASSNVSGGANGYTDTVQDSYGATPGQAGLLETTHVITETPGTQSGAYCGSADLSVTNAGSPAVVLAGNNITYTQTVANAGPLDAVNVVFSESVPASTTFQSINTLAGWTCVTPAVGGTGTITCKNPDLAANASGTFTVAVQVAAGTAYGAEIVDVDNVTSGTFDPNLANNTAIAINTVSQATQADLAITDTSSAPTVAVGSTFTMTSTVGNNGPATANNLVFTENTASNAVVPANATFSSISAPGWTCGTPAVGTSGTIYCNLASLAAGTSAGTIVITETAPSAPAGTVLSSNATIGSLTPDPNYGNNSASASVEIATAGQADLAVSASGMPNPVTAGNTIAYTQSVTNLGPNPITASATAPVTTVTFTDAIPPNTSLAAAFNPPANWTCNSIAIPPGTGTLTCSLNSGQTLAVGAVVNFPLVVKVNAGTTATTITNSPSVSSSVSDPNLANNTATVNTTVASPTQAFVTITKSASPEPVDQFTNLTYTILVTNNGPAVAQGVTVTDPIQTAAVSYVSASSSQGSCTAASNIVTCNLASLSVGGVATISINVTAQVVGSGSVTCNNQAYNACNVATLSTTTSNPNTSVCPGTTGPPWPTACAGSTIQYATAVDFASMSALQQTDGTVRVVWHTLEESRNLGFHVYREDASGRHRIDRSLIAGSALLLRSSQPQHAAKWYAWVDAQPVAGASYWVEDLDINGTRTMHGPAHPETASAAENQVAARSSETLAVSPSLGQLHSNLVPAPAPRRPSAPLPAPPSWPPALPPSALADHPAVKISVDQEGWYRITFAQLFAAGLDSPTDVRFLHLYAEGVEQPLLLTGRSYGAPAPSDAIEFYGTGIDTPFSGTRVYWLVRDNSFSKRMQAAPPVSSNGVAALNFPFTSIREDRSTYFAALLNGENNDNFFGDAVTSDPPAEETLTVTHRDTSSVQPLTLDIALQGVTDGQLHSVSVQFNGANLGTFDFYGEILATQSFTLDPSVVLDGTNTVSLTALNGDNDVSLVQSIQLHYPHTYTVDSDWLRATANAGSEVQISGFSNPSVRLFDITNPLSIVELNGQVSTSSGISRISATIPAGAPYTRTILAFSEAALSAPSALASYSPTFLDEQRAGADIIIITYPDFASHLAPLLHLRSSEGYRVLPVTTDELFDQFNYGERTPFAIRTFLQNAAAHWQRKPQAVLLVGDASMDPRNYLGFGDFDFVPTRIVETAAFKTASDDWFTDFQQNGFATIPTGRLPVRTPADLDLVISKIVGYEQGQSAGSWNSQVLLVADQNTGSNFSSAAQAAAATLPESLQSAQILTDGMDPAVARAQVIQALNNGALIVDYNGHGAEQQWSFSDLFDDNDAAALTNGGRLPVYLLIDCLNGLFQDVYAQSLAKSLMLAANGGAVAVWASSGFTNQSPQSSMELALLHELSAHPNESLGLMILHAKFGTTDSDVRRTWILFGDPAMRLNLSTTAGSTPISHASPNPPVPINPPRICPRGHVCTTENQR